ncbi:hypothetical protein ACE1CI_03910 [Aerosakkonemataceae cyanobacterium BLCC-F50]|uniref:Uncharacterized protein n=1 Tax=Floridaenema flaviceps BLCC-F50 TaxID=3153642 RepID=A0ABV4XK36_9CYAN
MLANEFNLIAKNLSVILNNKRDIVLNSLNISACSIAPRDRLRYWDEYMPI